MNGTPSGGNMAPSSGGEKQGRAAQIERLNDAAKADAQRLVAAKFTREEAEAYEKELTGYTDRRCQPCQAKLLADMNMDIDDLLKPLAGDDEGRLVELEKLVENTNNILRFMDQPEIDKVDRAIVEDEEELEKLLKAARQTREVFVRRWDIITVEEYKSTLGIDGDDEEEQAAPAQIELPDAAKVIISDIASLKRDIEESPFLRKNSVEELKELNDQLKGVFDEMNLEPAQRLQLALTAQNEIAKARVELADEKVKGVANWFGTKLNQAAKWVGEHKKTRRVIMVGGAALAAAGIVSGFAAGAGAAMAAGAFMGGLGGATTGTFRGWLSAHANRALDNTKQNVDARYATYGAAELDMVMDTDLYAGAKRSETIKRTRNSAIIGGLAGALAGGALAGYVAQFGGHEIAVSTDHSDSAGLHDASAGTPDVSANVDAHLSNTPDISVQNYSGRYAWDSLAHAHGNPSNLDVLNSVVDGAHAVHNAALQPDSGISLHTWGDFDPSAFKPTGDQWGFNIDVTDPQGVYVVNGNETVHIPAGSLDGSHQAALFDAMNNGGQIMSHDSYAATLTESANSAVAAAQESLQSATNVFASGNSAGIETVASNGGISGLQAFSIGALAGATPFGVNGKRKGRLSSGSSAPARPVAVVSSNGSSGSQPPKPTGKPVVTATSNKTQNKAIQKPAIPVAPAGTSPEVTKTTEQERLDEEFVKDLLAVAQVAATILHENSGQVVPTSPELDQLVVDVYRRSPGRMNQIIELLGRDDTDISAITKRQSVDREKLVQQLRTAVANQQNATQTASQGPLSPTWLATSAGSANPTSIPDSSTS